MLILLSLLLAAGFIALCHKSLRAHSRIYYCAAVVIAVVIGLADLSGLPALVQEYIVGLFSHGSFATALWIIIMWTGALKNGSPLIKKLMPIRGELSIFAAILTFGHNIFYGKTYFVRLFTNMLSLPGTQLAAAIISVAMILLLIPLTVTSFPAVRKKMQAKKWKKLQRWAYLYYGMLYTHIMLVTMPSANAGKLNSVISVAVYTVVFLSYLCFRVRKYLMLRKKADAKKTVAVAAAVVLVGMALICGELYAANRPAAEPASDLVAAAAEADEQEATAETGAVTVTASAYGYDGDVYVTITVDGGVITDITGYTEESDPYYFDMCFDKVSGAIIETQSCDVDAVSGATYSSQAIMDAVASALRKAEK